MDKRNENFVLPYDRCYYPHRSTDSFSPVCKIFGTGYCIFGTGYCNFTLPGHELLVIVIYKREFYSCSAKLQFKATYFLNVVYASYGLRHPQFCFHWSQVSKMMQFTLSIHILQFSKSKQPLILKFSVLVDVLSTWAD